MYYLFSFRSRNQSMKFYEMLRREGIFSKIVSTPRSVSVGCGLSVQVREQNLSMAKRIFLSYGFDTFIGLFLFNGQSAQRVNL